MKGLVEPLSWALVILIVGLVLVGRRLGGRSRAMVVSLLAVVILLAFTATPLARGALERSLAVDPDAGPLPDSGLVIVLGGGYRPGRTPDEDVLAEESERRVLHGVAVWRQHPAMRLMVSGAQSAPAVARSPGRLAELMADLARSRGVPAPRIVIEPRARNTREHPVEALRLPDVAPSTPLIVVTSDWHTRRARREFCRYFAGVRISPSTSGAPRLGWQSVLPDAGSLEASTTFLREWIALLWYKLGSAGSEPARC